MSEGAVPNVSLSDYRSGGYYVTKRVPRSDYLSAELLPPKILSLSTSLSTFVPDVWAFTSWSVKEEERIKEASKLGITPETLKELMAWATPRYDKEFDMSGECYSLDSAQTVAKRFFPEDSEIVVVGMGLHTSYQDAFWKPRKAWLDFVLKLLCLLPTLRSTKSEAACCKNEPLRPGGDVLGFELLSYELNIRHSWLDNGLEKIVKDNLGISPNRRGFLNTFDEAKRCAEYITINKIGEPGLWLPWLIVRYA